MAKPSLSQIGLDGARPVHSILVAWDSTADSGNGDFVVVEADNTGGLKSTATLTLPATSAFDVTVAPTVTSGAYSAGDIVGALLTFNVASAANAPIIINRVQVAIKAAVTSALTLHLFDADPTNTTKTDNAVYSLNAADVFKHITSIPITALGGYLTDHGTPNTYEVNNLYIPCKPVASGTSIYGLLVDGTGFTLTSTSDIQVRIAGTDA